MRKIRKPQAAALAALLFFFAQAASASSFERRASTPTAVAAFAPAPREGELDDGAFRRMGTIVESLRRGSGAVFAEPTDGDPESVLPLGAPVRTSPLLAAPEGRRSDPEHRPFLTLGFSGTRRSAVSQLEYATYLSQWYSGSDAHQIGLQHSADVVVHLDALSDRLPFYAYGDLYTFENRDHNASLQVDTFGAGWDKPLSRAVSVKTEVGRGYYSGDAAWVSSVRLEARLGLAALQGRPATREIERPLITAGLGLIAAQDTRHVRWTESANWKLVPRLLAAGWAALHFDALNPSLPFYLTASALSLSDERLTRTRRVGVYGAGLEKTLAERYTVKLEYDLGFYDGSQVSLTSAALSASYSLRDLLAPTRRSSPSGSPPGRRPCQPRA